jgi:hypothetical protein
MYTYIHTYTHTACIVPQEHTRVHATARVGWFDRWRRNTGQKYEGRRVAVHHVYTESRRAQRWSSDSHQVGANSRGRSQNVSFSHVIEPCA